MIIVVICALALAGGATGYWPQIITTKDHIPPPFVPPLTDKIGEVAGFRVLGLFFALGGFDCPSETEATINALNDDYLENEYLPRYVEAKGIWEWLDAVHYIYEPAEAPVDCPTCGFPHNHDEFKALALDKCARLNEISAEIDAIWVELAETAWVMVPEDSRQDFIDWVEEYQDVGD